MNRTAFLDVFRGVAVLLVFFYHTAINITLFGVPMWGYVGVHLFFVLSGYLLSQYFIAPREPSVSNLRVYAWRRFMRIYPAYAISLAIFVGLRLLSHSNIPSVGNVLAHYLLIFNYCDQYDFYSINGVYWSLAIEAQFYMLLPLFFLLVHRFSRHPEIVVALLMLVVGLVSRTLEFFYLPHVTASTGTLITFRYAPSYLDMFAIGIFLRAWELRAFTAMKTFSLSRVAALALVLVAIAGLFALGSWGEQCGHWLSSQDFLFTLLSPTLTCLCFAATIVAVMANEKLRRFCDRLTWLSWIGVISYSVYLYHVGVLYAVNTLLRVDHYVKDWTEMTWINAAIALPLTLLLAWIASVLFEKPFLRWSHLRKSPVAA